MNSAFNPQNTSPNFARSTKVTDLANATGFNGALAGETDRKNGA